MGATTSMVVAGQPQLKNLIPCVILWVPDAKSSVKVVPEKIYEEGGQQYLGKFWIEAREADFFKAVDHYTGKIHLVYGEEDRYVSKRLRDKTIAKIKAKGQDVMVLPNQNHSPWEFEVSRKVYKEELKFLNQHLAS